ncbi:hypothetical protein CM15mP35_02990 [bacterium]|nr:MAG: hypothetical protein CM15mP35_02990 [bacterium]
MGFFSISFILFFVTHNYKNERTHTSNVDHCCFENILRGGVGLYKSLILEDAPPWQYHRFLDFTLAVFYFN